LDCNTINRWREEREWSEVSWKYKMPQSGTMIDFRSRRSFLKTISLAGAGFGAWNLTPQWSRAVTSPFPGKYQPSWESLSRYQVPDWFRDAKLGAFIVWGPYAVPAYDSEWYPRNMYLRNNPAFEWHRQHWGPQSMFGYKDFIPLFRGEKWSPEGWIQLFKKAGAKYIVPIADFHDGFPMYDSNLTEWTAAKMGPCRDVVGELAREIRNQGLKFGVSSHRAFHWSFYTYETDFDTSNPLYAGLYGPIHAPTPLVSQDPGELRQKASREFLQDWYARSIELVDKYRPDLFYFDWGMGAPEFEPYRKQFAAYFYNSAELWNRGVVVTYKFKAYPQHAAVLDFERGLAAGIQELPWQTDTSVSWKSWGYIENDSFKSPSQIIHEFIDIVSKNGNLLLNVGPRSDGTIPEQAQDVYDQMGRWLEVNGEAIYGTRPWKVYGEGPTALFSGSFGEEKAKTLSFVPQDVRFTSKGETIYAILLAWPDQEARITELGKDSRKVAGKISDVRLLGSDIELQWQQGGDALTIQMPKQKPCDYAYAFRIVVNGA
jgi:alpha-L-fucosidase